MRWHCPNKGDGPHYINRCPHCRFISQGGDPRGHNSRNKGKKKVNVTMGKHIIKADDEAIDLTKTFSPEEPDDFPDKYPIIWAYLTQEKYDNGGYRQTATLLFFLEHGGIKVCLHDRQGHRSLFRRSHTFHGALDAIEAALSDDSADWKPKKV